MSSQLNVNQISSTSTHASYTPTVAVGGGETMVTIGNVTYRAHIFTSNGTFTVNSVGSNSQIEYLVVAGGGGGGMDMGGGGGGGGVLLGNTTITANTAYTITVGRGGWGAPGGSQYRGDGAGPQPGAHQFTIPATNGANSSFVGGAISLTAVGGGAGGSSYYPYTPGPTGNNGGSGGGASGYSDGGTRSGGTGTAGQGFDGGMGGGQYYSGGGGGAGGAGRASGPTGREATGGPGIYSDILGIGYYWGGGGGGSAHSYEVGGDGGIGGGGGGAVGTTFGGAGYSNGSAGGGGSPNSQTNTPGGNAGVFTGGGGGGSAHYNATNPGGNGGSGIVVVRYIVTDTTPTVTIPSGSAVASPGSVIQLRYVRTDARQSYSAPPSGIGTAIGELALTITPKKSNSLLVMRWMINGELHQDAMFVLHQDSDLLNQPGYQGYNNVIGSERWSGLVSGRYDENEDSTPSNWYLNFVIPAGSTVARTYYPAVRSSSSGTYSLALNRTVSSLGQDSYEAMISTGTIMEIAQ